MPFDAVAATVGGAAGIAIAVVAERLRSGGAPPPAVIPAPPPGPYDDDRSRRVLSALPFAALLVDGGVVVRFVNPAAERLFRIDSARAVGQGLIAVVPSIPLERQVITALRGQAATRDIPFGEGLRERTLGVTAHPFEGGAIVVAVDRTALVVSEGVRREFVANVSHELRTPLSSIKLMMETVLLSDDDAEARRIFLPQVSREVDRMIQLVEDLLALARSEAGTLVLKRSTFDLTETAAEVVNTFAQRSTVAQVELDLDAPEAVYVDADRNRLAQVAVNLVDNALRHTPAGGTVTVQVVREGADAVLRVRDTGRGIPFRDLPHLFERFYVVDRSRSREHSGTGLGLSISRHLVEAHGGTIGVESLFGKGATFTCRLPSATPPKH